MGETKTPDALAERMEAISRVWELHSQDWQAALEDVLANRPERTFEMRASIVVLAYETAARWTKDIARELGFDENNVVSDPQSLASYFSDAEDELFEICVDVSDPDHICLYWTTALYHSGDPNPCPDYDTALAAAREYLELSDPNRPQLF